MTRSQTFTPVAPRQSIAKGALVRATRRDGTQFTGVTACNTSALEAVILIRPDEGGLSRPIARERVEVQA